LPSTKFPKSLQWVRECFVFIPQSNDGFTIFFLDSIPSPIASDLCSNQILAKVQNVIWFNEHARGFSICPIQKINLGSFITFPKTPTMIPFNYTDEETSELDATELMYLLLETGNLSLFTDINIENDKFVEVKFVSIFMRIPYYIY
jgi:hypothetical protein